MTQRITRRLIEGKWYLCKDTGCPDLEAAAQNRLRIKRGYATEWWLWYESIIRLTPMGKPLPESVPIGELPQVGKGIQRKGEDYE